MRGIRVAIRLINRLPGKSILQRALRIFHPPKRLTQSFPYTGSVSMHLDAHRSIVLKRGGNQVFWRGLDGTGEPHSLRLWTALCKEADVIVDIGAHIGIYSLTAAASTRASNILAFEPLPSNRAMLLENVVANGFSQITVRAEAVSDQEGQEILSYDREGEAIAMLGVRGMKHSIHVGVTTLDRIRKQLRLPTLDLIKIDVEKHEYRVLLGAVETIRECTPTLLIEILDDEIGMNVQRFLGTSYQYLFIDEKGTVRRAAELRRVDDHSTNYLCYPTKNAHNIENIVRTHSLFVDTTLTA